MKQKTGSFLLRHALQSFGIIIILAILIRTFLISSFVMSGWSMLPNIWPGDFLLANKLAVHKLHRGDVVVLRCPGTKEQICLKRVIGLPGDRIEFIEGDLTINGERSRHQNVTDGVDLEMVQGARWLVWPVTKGSQVARVAPIVIPPREVYLLNDKRSFLEDSRSWGPIKMHFLEAKVWRVWLSLDWYDGNVVRSTPRLRWSRMLRSID